MFPWTMPGILRTPFRADGIMRHPPAPSKRKAASIQRYPRALAGLMYARCTQQELLDSLRSRRGSASDDSNSRYLRGLLRQLDEDWTFRFTELPAELRNMVYYELLKPETKTGRPANINIMFVSKQLYQEAEHILYETNPVTIEYRPGARTMFNGRALPQSSGHRTRRGRPGTVAAEYARLPKATCLKVQHLRLLIVVDEDAFDMTLNNRRLLALANVFGGSSALKTVEVQAYGMFFTTKPMYKAPEVWLMDMETLLYPLTKLKSTDVKGSLRARRVTFVVPSRRVQHRLERQMVGGTPRPVDAVGTLTDMLGRTEEIEKSRRHLPPFDPQFDSEFEVFVSALGTVSKDFLVPEAIDYKTDSRFCKKIESLKMVFEKLEPTWQKYVSENMWERMHGAQGGIHWESTRDAEDWLDEQRVVFEIGRMLMDEVIVYEDEPWY